eukprot:gnl/TRDRNA2_/TRDRNA2_186901_c0_seq1.p1 gnl/TRDRNA2_/TRDRNA2_186901_c0~~gnl/TRDRNA2_/TRDRNA2_186901_c0_seq1.p1  ORF type:complete len:511 (-),score=107.41 gnl/TRDRNA2_/TRDRNA2_186901_c0_seq1:179-1567(-)
MFGETVWPDHVVTAFDEFRVNHGRKYEYGTDEYSDRLDLFHRRYNEVKEHNARQGNWWKTLNHFADLTDSERAQWHGWRHMDGHRSGGSVVASLVAFDDDDSTEDPKEKDWTHLKAAKHMLDQGSCGSCWAIAGSSVLEARYEIANQGKHRTFSPQEMLAGTCNEKECGGKGGCSGATVELAYQYVMANGLQDEHSIPYKAFVAEGALEKACKSWKTKAGKMQLEHEPASAHGGQAIGMTGWHTLPQNKYKPLLQAVVNGPVAVSVGAGDWFLYSGGVFDSCEKDLVLNHAVTAYGFGEDNGVKYWKIRNSWGKHWGEKGFIRLLRLTSDHAHCGTDNNPQEGVGCKGGPAKVTVCGMCGVHYDSVVPHFVADQHHSASLSHVAEQHHSASLSQGKPKKPATLQEAVDAARDLGQPEEFVQKLIDEADVEKDEVKPHKKQHHHHNGKRAFAVNPNAAMADAE